MYYRLLYQEVNNMHPAFQSYFVTPDTHQPLFFHGTYDEARWSDGELVTTTKEHRFAVVDTVPIFVTKGITWPDGCVEEYGITPEWVSRKMEQYRTRELNPWGYPPIRENFCRRMASSNQLILELAIGPDGGNMPFVLLESQEAIILANELGYNVLRIWREYQKQYSFAPNLSFACFDARHIPLESECINIISSRGAFTEISRSTDVALKEAYRILKPGGRMYLCEDSFTPETVSELPADVQKKHGLPRPEYTDLLKGAGFDILSEEKYAEIPGQARWGDLFRDAEEHGVTLQVQMFAIEAEKNA
jgi:SAM-dependent methyltransferase